MVVFYQGNYASNVHQTKEIWQRTIAYTVIEHCAQNYTERYDAITTTKIEHISFCT